MANGLGFSPDALSLFGLQAGGAGIGQAATNFGAALNPAAAPAAGFDPNSLRQVSPLPPPPPQGGKPDSSILAAAEGNPNFAAPTAERGAAMGGAETAAAAANLAGTVGSVATLNPLAIAGAVSTLPGNILNLVKGISDLFPGKKQSFS